MTDDRTLVRIQLAPPSVGRGARGASPTPRPAAPACSSGPFATTPSPGRRVTELTYEAWDELAKERLDEIAARDPSSAGPSARVALLHATGHAGGRPGQRRGGGLGAAPRGGVRGVPVRDRGAQARRARSGRRRPSRRATPTGSWGPRRWRAISRSTSAPRASWSTGSVTASSSTTPTVVALNAVTNEVVAVGEEAWRIIGSGIGRRRRHASAARQGTDHRVRDHAALPRGRDAPRRAGALSQAPGARHDRVGQLAGRAARARGGRLDQRRQDRSRSSRNRSRRRSVRACRSRSRSAA